MNALAEAYRCTEQSEAIDTVSYAQLNATLAGAYAAIAQAEALQNIARELGRLNDSANLITSLEAEIVLDIVTRRSAERASYLAYHRAYAEAEEKADPLTA
jgi:hypothetical protein